MRTSSGLKTIMLPAIAASVLLLFIFCTGKKNNGVTNPVIRDVTMNGTVTLPAGMATAFPNVQVGLGDNDKTPDSLGNVVIKGKEHVPGLATLHDSTGPILMSIVPDPQDRFTFQLNARTTAEALAYLSPLICSGNSSVGSSVLRRLDSLPEVDALESVISYKLQSNPSALTVDDPDIDWALTNVVNAYLNSYPAEMPSWLTDTNPPTHQSARSATSTPPDIFPSTSVSGLTLSWVSGNTYEISNAFGRWAYACTPQDSFFVFPNGDLLDALKLKKPWSPSTRKFTMQIDPGDTEYVDIYGYGFMNTPTNVWDSLSHAEQNNAHAGGITTVVMELFCNVVSVITNTPRVFGNETIAQKWGKTGWDFILRNSRITQRAVEYIKEGNPYGLSWYLTKQIISEAAMSPAYREFLASTVGLLLSDAAIEKLATFLLVPAKVVVDLNSVTSVLKTAMALTTGHFATEFRVFKIMEDFGGVSGNVGDKQSGNPIAGVRVHLSGDDHNPQAPAHDVTTDNSGHFAFSNISTGDKQLTASKDGYNSATVTVTINKDAIAHIDIPLERQAGGLTGHVVNDIYVHNSITPTTFRGSTDITARRTDGTGQPGGVYAYDGIYSISLPLGGWWIIASHDDFASDSFAINITGSGNVLAPRDLVLKPRTSVTGTISLNMDNVGPYERVFDIDFPQAGISKPATYLGPCPLGGTPTSTMDLVAVRGATQSDFDGFSLSFNTSLITAAGVVPVGGIEQYGCSGQHVASTVTFQTSREHCVDSIAGQFPLTFFYSGDPTSAGCNCAITVPGNIFLENWGTQVGDTVAGTLQVTLPGWKGCSCSGSDTNNDGRVDTWKVSCASAVLDIRFRTFVGTDYLVTLRPNGVSGFAEIAKPGR